MKSFRTGLALVVALGLGTAPHTANAFTHVVVQGDTLASIAEKYYGKIQYEKFLVDANLLGLEGGSPIVKGMRLEVPSVGHRTVKHGDTWEALSAELLGAGNRQRFPAAIVMATCLRRGVGIEARGADGKLAGCTGHALLVRAGRDVHAQHPRETLRGERVAAGQRPAKARTQVQAVLQGLRHGALLAEEPLL